MTASDILRIVYTISFAQGICDVLAYCLIYSKEPYKRSLLTLERIRTRLDRTSMNLKSADKSARTNSKTADKKSRKIKRLEDEFSEAAVDVTKRHTGPKLMTSLVFVILYRILSLEYSGKVVAVLPFKPFPPIIYLSMRGLNFNSTLSLSSTFVKGELSRMYDPTQACAFMFIYILSTFSVKYVVHRFIGSDPPLGADKGIMNFLDDPRSKQILHGMGMDADNLRGTQKLC